MDTFQRVKQWLAATLAIREEVITPQSTLGELFGHRSRTASPEDHPTTAPPLRGNASPDSLDLIELVLAFEEAIDLEFSDAEAEALNGVPLDQSTTVQQIVELIDRA